uniref:Neur_chan_LBD domain-containing protein n=1 Tax=Ascaris lumbricoides TaxID=6252 RepID=A0A0M3HIP7_ASCLU
MEISLNRCSLSINMSYFSHHYNQAVRLISNNDVRVNYTGHLRYYIPFSTESLCKLDVKFFPFDM